ncbi:aminomethyltransferase family protein, partial [Planktotalea sp.]|uniref:aminomethyltransferase family protein n=1 Tax=Planktotalea sp. TaxID=2029877 RepID=UPI00329962A8
IGRMSLTPMLSPKGRLIGDFTVSCLGEQEFQVTASYGSQAYHMRWFQQNMEDGVTLENVSDKHNGFQIAGPKAREVLAACTRTDISDMKFMDVQRMTVGMAECIVQRVSYTGDLGYEIYCDLPSQRQLWWTLWSAGEPIGMQPFGMRAMMSLRLDKFFGSWLSEFSPDYTAAETGLDRFISFKKNTDFIGRAAAEEERKTPPARQLCAFEVDADNADVVAYEPIWIDGEVLGFCTSGGYSHTAGKSIAQALIPRELAKEGLEVNIEILGDMRKARLITTPLFDADNARMRG